MQVLITKQVRVQGKAVEAGAEITVSEADAGLLINTGKAVPVDDAVAYDAAKAALGIDRAVQGDALTIPESDVPRLLSVMVRVVAAGDTIASGAPDLDKLNAALAAEGAKRSLTAGQRDVIWAQRETVANGG